jgi:hypothetical protein
VLNPRLDLEQRSSRGELSLTVISHQWSVRAIERSMPCLFGLFSLIVLMAKSRHGDQLLTRRAAWYNKVEVFSCIA